MLTYPHIHRQLQEEYAYWRVSLFSSSTFVFVSLQTAEAPTAKKKADKRCVIFSVCVCVCVSVSVHAFPGVGQVRP